MRKIFLILAAVYAGFIIEGLLGNYFGRWFKPNLLVTLIVFFNLSRGTRYSLVAAVAAGLLQDSFVPLRFGFHTFAFICCAFLASLFKVYFYQIGSTLSRLLVLFLVLIMHDHIMFFLNLVSFGVNYGEMWRYILLPEIVVTLAVSAYAFNKFKICVLKYFV